MAAATHIFSENPCVSSSKVRHRHCFSFLVVVLRSPSCGLHKSTLCELSGLASGAPTSPSPLLNCCLCFVLDAAATALPLSFVSFSIPGYSGSIPFFCVITVELSPAAGWYCLHMRREYHAPADSVGPAGAARGVGVMWWVSSDWLPPYKLKVVLKISSVESTAVGSGTFAVGCVDTKGRSAITAVAFFHTVGFRPIIDMQSNRLGRQAAAWQFLAQTLFFSPCSPCLLYLFRAAAHSTERKTVHNTKTSQLPTTHHRRGPRASGTPCAKLPPPYHPCSRPCPPFPVPRKRNARADAI